MKIIIDIILCVLLIADICNDMYATRTRKKIEQRVYEAIKNIDETNN